MHFNNNFNNVCSKFGHVQPDIISRFLNHIVVHFTEHFYGNIIRAVFPSAVHNGKSVCKIFALPPNTHQWLLGMLINQYHISYQLYARDIKFLHSINKCYNIIVRQYMFNAFQNANNIIGYKFAFYRCKLGLNLFDRDLQYCLQRCKPASSSTEKQSHNNCVHTLSLS